jgi:phosphonate transport system substrate-binding protein
MRFLVISEPLAGRVYLLNQKQAARRELIEATLWAFAASAEGKAYFEKYKLDGYRRLKPKELEAMEPYARETRLTLQ